MYLTVNPEVHLLLFQSYVWCTALAWLGFQRPGRLDIITITNGNIISLKYSKLFMEFPVISLEKNYGGIKMVF